MSKTLTKEIKKAWRKEIKKSGLSTLCKEAVCDYRTINRALRTGNCNEKSFDQINRAIIHLRSKRQNDPIVNQLLADDNN